MKKYFLLSFLSIFLTLLFLSSKTGWSDRFLVIPPHYSVSRYPCQSSPGQQNAQLEIAAAPSKSECFINHKAVGKTPLCLTNLAPGKYLIRIDAGLKYLPYIKTITISRGETARIHAALEKKAEVWFHEGLKALKSSSTKKAIHDFTQAAAGKPMRVSNAYYWLGLLYKKENKLNSAVKALRQFIFYRGNKYPTAFYELGKIYKKQNKEAKALIAFQMAVTNLPEFKNVLKSTPKPTWNNISNLKQTTISDPDDLTNRVKLAFLYEEKGGFKKAIHQLETVLTRYKTALDAEKKELEKD